MGQHNHRLTDREVIQLLKQGVYEVCPLTGTVTRQGKPITVSVDKDGYRFVRLYHNGTGRRQINLARLVWISKTRQPVPKRYEIHHRDRRPENNAWTNLFCLHKDDHKKLHGGDLLEEPLPD